MKLFTADVTSTDYTTVNSISGGGGGEIESQYINFLF